MDKKSLIIVAMAVVLLGAGWGVHLLTSKSSEKSESQSAGHKEKVVNVDDVVSDPEKFAGILSVEGIVTKVDEANSAFTLGCEDACIQMPVKFQGRLPKEGANVIAFGEVKKTEQSKYIFIAQKIQTK